ncbi:hypothetical protein GDO86_016191 [Hymenochirus boettgeri]|uniref:MAX gene-associated protein n=1 Tax=Hymenochirus boettgeri TaxID=247094 RepID=A0A8T2K486_9PIPI|nr:hypothetical protein GDO86_016191 [Hymenochirus boettgeri]
MEKHKNPLTTEEGNKSSLTPPAYFVILQQSQGNGKKEGILVANRDVSSVAPIVSSGSDKSKTRTFLSADCKSGNITVTLDNNNMWNEFYHCSTEMVLTKQGRRMFPYCRYWITGLDPYQKYILVMDITPMDNHRYKWNGKWWEAGGKSEPHVLGRVFIHPESPSTGQYWMHQPVSFYKLKLTNNILDQEGHIILHSMHRYLPRLHIVPAQKDTEVIHFNGPDVHTFTFPQTEFIAVTAYQNFQITQLKIDCNPFAKGFREGAVTGKPVKDTKSKNCDLESNSQCTKTPNDPESIQNLREIFRASENSDGDTEPEAFNAEQDFLQFAHPHVAQTDGCKMETNCTDSPAPIGVADSSAGNPTLKAEGQLITAIKQEPADNEYNKDDSMQDINIKQESEEEVTDEYSNSDDDYPILEKQFAQFRKEPHVERKRSLNSPFGVAKAKMLKLDSNETPLVCLESCNVDYSTVQKKMPKEKILNLQTKDVSSESCQSINTHVIKGSSDKNIQKLNKSHNDTCCVKPKVLNIGNKKLPFILSKVSLSHTLHKSTLPLVKNKRGRPRKHKPAEPSTQVYSPLQVRSSFPDFNPDLEDVDGVLFVAFSSKEALDFNTGGKKKKTPPCNFLIPPVNVEKGTLNEIMTLEKQLVEDLQTMKYNQVIHPALQQVGLKLNIVDQSMSIDLRYLGVQLPLPYIGRNARWNCYELCSQVSRSPFISRTGKTTDYTKIKGWRDKFLSNVTSLNSESTKPSFSGSNCENVLKNLSAFCSDELDEYLENEAKLMENCNALPQNETASSDYQLPTESPSSVKTFDNVLKKHNLYATASTKALKSHTTSGTKNQTRTLHKTSTSKVKANVKTCEKTKESPTISPITLTPAEASSESVKDLPLSCNVGPSLEDSLLSGLKQTQLTNQQSHLRPVGFSKAYTKLLNLEENNVWEGKSRTYITEERADICLTVLLTAQDSLKNKPVQKIICKQAAPCNKLFCRLGCVCQSLNHSKRSSLHCHLADCMLGCVCIENRELQEKSGINNKGLSESMQQTSNQGKPFQPIAGFHSEKSKEKAIEDEKDICGLKLRTSVRFPIWNKNDCDPEPIHNPKQATLDTEYIIKLPHMESQELKKDGSPNISKAGDGSMQSPVASKEDSDPVYMFFDGLMTCARVRIYERKPLEEMAKQEQCICDSSDVNEKDSNSKQCKGREKKRGMELMDDVEDCCAPTKLIDIISDCSWEEDRSKILNIVSQRMTNSDPQSFKVGSFNIELASEGKISGHATGSTYSSRVKISMAPSETKDKDSEKWKTERIKLTERKLTELGPDTEQLQKSHGGKGLPFYTKIMPAGKLIARLQTSNIHHDLIQVNGKNYPRAKLLLGQMGALHPANRLAAYITHRLRPSLYNLSKCKEINERSLYEDLTSSSSSSEKAKENAASVLDDKMPPPNTIVPTRPSVVPAGMENRLGPRLLLIPVQSNSRPVRPISTVPQTPGQKMVLQPIRSPGKNLFRHPNGQIIQLVPLQQVRGGNVHQRTQQFVLRNPGATMGVRLSLQTKSETVIPQPSSIVSSSVPTVSVSTGSVGSLSKISPITQASPVISQEPSFLSQIGTMRLRIVPPVNSNETSQVNAKIITYNSGGQSVSSTNCMPFQSGSFALLKVPSQAADSGAVPNITTSQNSNTNPNVMPTGTQDISAKCETSVDTIEFKCPKNTNNIVQSSLPSATTVEPSGNNDFEKIVPSSNAQNGSPNFEKRGTSLLEQNINVECEESGTSIVDQNINAKCKKSGPSPVEQNINAECEKSGTHPAEQNVNDEFKNSSTSHVGQNYAECEKSGPSPVEQNINSECKKSSTSPVTFPIDHNKNPECENLVLSPIKQNGNDGKKTGTDHMEDVNTGTLLQQCGNNEADSVMELSSNTECSRISASHVEQNENIECKKNEVLSPVEKNGNPECKKTGTSPVEYSSLIEPMEIIFREEDAFDDSVHSNRGNSKEAAGSPRILKTTNESQLPKTDGMHTQCPEKSVCDIEQKVLTKCAYQPKTKECAHEAPALFTLEESPENVLSRTSETMIKCNEKSYFYEDGITLESPKGLDSPDFINTDNQDCLNLDVEDSEIDEAVDIETVEELSEKINIARLKASINRKMSSNPCSAHIEYMETYKKGLKNVDPFMRDDEEDTNDFHRRTHTANERKRRNEMRDLFDELKNALGLHNLPKVSKSYILKQAIEEIEGLTDLADTLIRKKSLLSQTQNHLIKKVSNLSGKPKDLVLKKLEYVHAKQKAVEAEKKKKNLEEDLALHKASMLNAVPLKKTFPPLGNETAPILGSSNAKKPIILAKRPMPIAVESKSPQQISITASNLLVTSQGQLVTLKGPVVPGQVSSVPSAVIQAELSPRVAGSMQQGLASVVIQLPGTIQVKGLIGNTSIPITIVPNSAAPTKEAEKDDLSMMPKIVNVTSLANETSVNLDANVEPKTTAKETRGDFSQCSVINKAADCGAIVEQGAVDTTPKVSHVVLKETYERISLVPNKVPECKESNLSKDVACPHSSSCQQENSGDTKSVILGDKKTHKGNQESRTQGECKKVSSSLDEPDLEASSLIDVIGDHEDSDETLTSLLNEIAFLNHPLDTDDMDSGSDFAGSETASRNSAGKLTDGNESLLSFKELPEIKEKNVSLSPLFLQLEEGEIQECVKQNKEADLTFVADTNKSLSSADSKTHCLQGATGIDPSNEKLVKQETSCTQMLWRPMPKLAPLGLKAAAMSAAHSVHESKAMPALAPVTMRLNPPKSTFSDEQNPM